MAGQCWLPSLWRVESFKRRPLGSAVVSANFGARNRTAVEFAVVYRQRINFGAIHAHASDDLPIFAALVFRHLCFRPSTGVQFSLIELHGVCLKKPILTWGQ